MKKVKHIGILFILPWIIGFCIFTLYPFLATFVLSFTRYTIIDPPNFVSVSNYKDMLDDPDFWKSISVTFLYVALTVPLKLVFALFIAIILNFKLKGISFFRTAFYIPSILGGNIAIAVLWTFLFSSGGLINQVIELFGFEPVPFFSIPFTAMLSMSLLRVWQFGSAMVIFFAALRDIPESLYDASKVDGAGKIRTFFYVTIPLITPIIFFNFIMQTIQAFQEFNAPYMITKGGPLKSTYLMSLMIYEHSFHFFNMGYASALAWTLFIIILICMLLIFKTSDKWVYYAYDEQNN
jgi:oligogalacturonide transport system permease protein